MDSIADNLSRIRSELLNNVTLVAVSKTRSNELIMEAHSMGQRVFGENRVQELVAKSEELPKDIEWHMIGHLQSNKVRYIAPFISCIHSVDKPKLLSAINREAEKCGRIIKVLLQFHIATEETKYGLNFDEAEALLSAGSFSEMKNIEVIGVMGMATFTDDEGQVRAEFRSLKNIFLKFKRDHFADRPEFKEISMGMSGDLQLAIEEGSTMVRVGSSIFGIRN